MNKSANADLYNMVLLVVLYTIQGVPTGLVFGSIPFLIQQSSSYTALGIFSFASYPYSLKLLWSPIVDSLFIRSFGRRKSWIIPIQLIAGMLLLYISSRADEMINSAQMDIYYVTFLFFFLIFLMATQDIAVDGWALELLNKENIGYASTCQTIGLNFGFFMSYTIFLALNSPEFCNSYLRTVPSNEGIVSLGGYLSFWGIVYIAFTIALALFKREKPTLDNNHQLDIIGTYKEIISIIKSTDMRTLIVVLLTCKLGFVVADAVTPIKLVEKGFRKDNMAVVVTIAFPFEFLFALMAGKWARGEQPLNPWKLGFLIRTCIAIFGMVVVYFFPDSGNITFSYYLLVLGVFLLYSLCSNFMFVAQGGFFAKIADSRIGGTYMTLLNTISNFGGTYPKFFVFYLIDIFTKRGCVPINDILYNLNNVSKWGCSPSTVSHGTNIANPNFQSCPANEKCVVLVDGYYIVGLSMALIGFLLYFFWTSKTLDELQKSFLSRPNKHNSTVSND